jgi:hypothetical protein
VDSLHIKRIYIEDLVPYVYIVRVDYICTPLNSRCLKFEEVSVVYLNADSRL